MSSINKIKTLGNEIQGQRIHHRDPGSYSLKKLHTKVNQKLHQGYKYDKMLFHKTIYHLRPMEDNPELFTRQISLNQQALGTLKYQQATHTKSILPHPVAVKLGLQKVPGRSKLLCDDTLTHITAKKWLIYNMEAGTIVKGYKYRQSHDVASLSKLLTFYTAYDIIREYFLAVNTFEIMLLPNDSKVGGTLLRVNSEEQKLLYLQDALYALLMVSANNIANAIANNLGSYLRKQREGQYFSCFDLLHENRELNIGVFMVRMKKLIKQMQLKDSVVTSPHGTSGNTSSALDMAKVAAECFKIPLFYKIVITKRICIKTKHIDEDGEVAHKTILLENTNKLLGKGCLGGKTGSSIAGGESFLGAFPGSIVIIVLGSAGREERFHDCMRLAEWVTNKLSQKPTKK